MIARLVLLVASTAVIVACGQSSPGTGPEGAADASAMPGDAATGDAAIADSGVPDSGACPTAASPAPGTVLVESGAAVGTRSGDAWAFKGIPYASPPLGELRWRAPQPPGCFAGGALDAAAYGDRCPQFDANDEVVGAEDCLTLNVWTPASPPDAAMPVMVFIHGGGNVQGSSAEQWYDGAHLAARGVVLVTFNYRLGVLGYFAHPALSAASPAKVSGNYGLLDQIAALKWVQRNVAAFGGDPRRVMIFGESAGARNVCALLASPLAAGLFHAALMQSGACVQPTLTAVEAFGIDVVSKTPCASAADPVACMRALPMDDVLRAFPAHASVAGKRADQFESNVDGYVLTRSPLEALRAGEHNKVPFIVGANADETAKELAANPPATDAEYKARLTAGFGAALGAAVYQRYPTTDYSPPEKAAAKALVQVTTDARFVCPARAIARAAAAHQSQPVFRYFFTQASSLAPALGAFHGLELTYVFNVFPAAPTLGDAALSDAMQGYWSRLAAAGDPNGAGASAWPRYDATRDPYLELGERVAAGDGVRTDKCDFWDRWMP